MRFLIFVPPLIHEVYGVVTPDRFELFKRVCTHDMCLNFGQTPLIKMGYVVCVY